jgi:hypothetical protein
VAILNNPIFKTYFPLVVLAILLLVGIRVLARLMEEAEEEDDDPETPEDMLAEFEQAHAAGELNDEEYQRVRALLGQSRESPASRPRPVPKPPLPEIILEPESPPEPPVES